MTAPALQVVVMGVASTGKSAVGRRLADRLGLAFVEGDDHHSEANIAKMSAGVPLTDEDRRPWLTTLAQLLARSRAEGRSTVLTCSALRRSYRDLLRGSLGDAGVFFVHLDAPVEVLRERMSRRSRHFMPTSLLQSQLDTLEPLEPGERGVRVDVSPPLEEVVETVVAAVTAALGRP
jgi:gluconokinase